MINKQKVEKIIKNFKYLNIKEDISIEHDANLRYIHSEGMFFAISYPNYNYIKFSIEPGYRNIEFIKELIEYSKNELRIDHILFRNLNLVYRDNTLYFCKIEDESIDFRDYYYIIYDLTNMKLIDKSISEKERFEVFKAVKNLFKKGE